MGESKPESEIEAVSPIVVSKSDFVLVDVREAEAFELGHIEGAINIPKQTNKWPTLRKEIRSLAQEASIVVIDDGVEGDGEEVADLLLRVLKKHSGIAVMQGGMKAYCYHQPRLPLVGSVDDFPEPEEIPRKQGSVDLIEIESPLEDERVEEIVTMVNETFGARIHDLPKELKYDHSNVGREVKRLRVAGFERIEDTGVRYRVFCAYERKTLVGVLVLKHCKIGSPDRWAIVKYICSIRKGIGYYLQKRCWDFCRSELGVSSIYAGAWLEFPHAWRSHLKWGYHFSPFKDWPRSANSTYGSGVVGMRKDLSQTSDSEYPAVSQ